MYIDFYERGRIKYTYLSKCSATQFIILHKMSQNIKLAILKWNILEAGIYWHSKEVAEVRVLYKIRKITTLTYTNLIL